MPSYVIDIKCSATKTVLVEATSKSEARKKAMVPFANVEVVQTELGLPISCGPAIEDNSCPRVGTVNPTELDGSACPNCGEVCSATSGELDHQGEVIAQYHCVECDSDWERDDDKGPEGSKQ